MIFSSPILFKIIAEVTMKILLADKLSPNVRIFLDQHQFNTAEDPALKDDSLLAALRQHQPEVLVIRSTKVRAEHIQAAPSLALIIRAGAGVNNIDMLEASKRGIFVANCPGKNAIAVAELAFGHIITLDRKIADNVADFRNGIWAKKKYSKSKGLHGKTLALFGLGAIGSEVLIRAKAFGMNIHVYDPYIENKFDEYEIRYFQNLTTALCNADCISLNLPKVDKPIITKENSQYLKHGVVIINTARGELIEEKVLKDGIQEGIISGVGLDVFDSEPIEKNHFLFKYKQVIFTPHQAGLSQEAAQRMSIKSINNILDYYDGSLDSSLIVNGVKI